MMKKSAIVGAAAWVAPAVVPMGSGTGTASAASATCVGCLGLTGLSPGNALTGSALNITVNSNVDFWCGCGCIQSGTYVWTVPTESNCTLDTAGANSAFGGTGDSTLKGTIAVCGTVATAEVHCTTTLKCENPDGRSTTYSSSLGVNATWTTTSSGAGQCGASPATGTQLGTVTYDPAGPACHNRSHGC